MSYLCLSFLRFQIFLESVSKYCEIHSLITCSKLNMYLHSTMTRTQMAMHRTEATVQGVERR